MSLSLRACPRLCVRAIRRAHPMPSLPSHNNQLEEDEEDAMKEGPERNRPSPCAASAGVPGQRRAGMRRTWPG